MKILLIIIGAIGLVFVLALLFTFPTLWLWNWLMPVIFGVTKITFWQAFGLNLLAGILFKSSSTSKSD